MKVDWTFIWIFAGLALLLLLAANVADYFYQADMHGWNLAGLWERGYRNGDSFPLPTDPWHWAQTIRNAGTILGTVCAVHLAVAVLSVILRRVRTRRENAIHYVLVIVVPILFWYASRGLGFSLLYRILNG